MAQIYGLVHGREHCIHIYYICRSSFFVEMLHIDNSCEQTGDSVTNISGWQPKGNQAVKDVNHCIPNSSMGAS
jgi:hypothetical protein